MIGSYNYTNERSKKKGQKFYCFFYSHHKLIYYKELELHLEMIFLFKQKIQVQVLMQIIVPKLPQMLTRFKFILIFNYSKLLNTKKKKITKKKIIII